MTIPGAPHPPTPDPSPQGGGEGPRYALADLPPGVVRYVTVFWCGREFAADRVRDGAGWGWVLPVMSGQPLDWLPEALGMDDAPAEPEWWRPPAGFAWPGGVAPRPLPEPESGRLVSLPSGPTHYTYTDEQGRSTRVPFKGRYADGSASCRMRVSDTTSPTQPSPAAALVEGRGSKRWAAMTAQAEASAAAQAELAAELGAAAGERLAGGEREPQQDAEPQQKLGSRWWLVEPQLVTYSPPGAEITRDEVEGRLCRAILTDGLRPGQRPLAFAGTASALAAMVHETLTSADARTFEPTRADYTDQDGGAPFAWFAALNPPQLRHRHAESWALNGLQAILVHHACGQSWRKIAKETGGSHEYARQSYETAIDAAWRAANGRPVFDHVTIRDEMAELRARSRRAKRRG